MQFRTFVIACGSLALLGGCASESKSTRRQSGIDNNSESEAQLKKTIAEFYWQYAALAADVYEQNKFVPNNNLLLSSSWLSSEVEKTGEAARIKYRVLHSPQGVGVARTQMNTVVPSEDDRAVPNLDPFQDALPSSSADCDPPGDQDPVVPLSRAARSYHWERVPEFAINTQARGWSIFVPDLAIDVWRRPRSPDGAIVEYAIAYRGTTGKGGWISNLRGITSITPVTWDQYRQARRATQQIVSQAKRLHDEGNVILGISRKTTLLFTTVGHSLGAGIATYVYTVVPQITRAVGFDPSPIDGSSSLSVLERSQVMTKGGPRRDQKLDGEKIKPTAEGKAKGPAVPQKNPDDDDERPIDSDGLNPPASVYLLYEKGEVLSRFFPCQSGRKWADEGGPTVSCESVNFLKGNWVRQHSMSRMACMLYLARKGYFEPQGAANHEAFLRRVREHKESPDEELFESF